MIVFNKPPFVGSELEYIEKACNSGKISGDGYYGKECQKWFENQLGCYKALLTPSCTAGLEMAAILIGIEPGDEVIMPSYTFVSTANAFVLRGAKVIFVDIHPDTMNIDESLIEDAITDKTKAIVPVHYAGVSCDMDKIMEIADKYGLFVVEDAAQAMMSKYNEEPVGIKGHLSAFSFHETKNYTSGGEGGLLVINDEQFAEKAEIIREKGTNRSQFFRGMVDKYSWVDVGSSYLPSELQAAYLYAQLEEAEKINGNRLSTWHKYYTAFQNLEEKNLVTLPKVPGNCTHNAHMFFLRLKNLEERASFIQYLKDNGVMAVFHYIPLHSAQAGEKYSQFFGKDNYTTADSERLVRLPLYYGITEEEVDKVITLSCLFFLDN